APAGNRNALRHGKYTRDAFAFRAEICAHLRRSRAILAWLRAIELSERQAYDLRQTRVWPPAAQRTKDAVASAGGRAWHTTSRRTSTRSARSPSCPRSS